MTAQFENDAALAVKQHWVGGVRARRAYPFDAGLPVFNILHGLRDVLQLARAGCGVFQIAVADQEQLAAQVLIGGAEAFELGLLSFDAAAQLIALRREAMDPRWPTAFFEVLV